MDNHRNLIGRKTYIEFNTVALFYGKFKRFCRIFFYAVTVYPRCAKSPSHAYNGDISGRLKILGLIHKIYVKINITATPIIKHTVSILIILNYWNFFSAVSNHRV
ncbi:MAG: hypothetical protein ACYCWE_13390 [Eubacteriales bacterium]